jgi:hypothetical protein
MGAGTGPFLYHPTSILLIKRQAPVVLLIHQTKRRSSGLGVVADIIISTDVVNIYRGISCHSWRTLI